MSVKCNYCGTIINYVECPSCSRGVEMPDREQPQEEESPIEYYIRTNQLPGDDND